MVHLSVELECIKLDLDHCAKNSEELVQRSKVADSAHAASIQQLDEELQTVKNGANHPLMNMPLLPCTRGNFRERWVAYNIP